MAVHVLNPPQLAHRLLLDSAKKSSLDCFWEGKPVARARERALTYRAGVCAFQPVARRSNKTWSWMMCFHATTCARAKDCAIPPHAAGSSASKIRARVHKCQGTCVHARMRLRRGEARSRCIRKTGKPKVQKMIWCLEPLFLKGARIYK